jgi:type I restriction enzyme S subunit
MRPWDGVDRLTQAVLAKAFRGELVATEAELARREGRGFESGEQLLAQIRQARPAAPIQQARKTKSREENDAAGLNSA